MEDNIELEDNIKLYRDGKSNEELSIVYKFYNNRSQSFKDNISEYLEVM